MTDPRIAHLQDKHADKLRPLQDRSPDKKSAVFFFRAIFKIGYLNFRRFDRPDEHLSQLGIFIKGHFIKRHDLPAPLGHKNDVTVFVNKIKIVVIRRLLVIHKKGAKLIIHVDIFGRIGTMLAQGSVELLHRVDNIGRVRQHRDIALFLAQVGLDLIRLIISDGEQAIGDLLDDCIARTVVTDLRRDRQRDQGHKQEP